MAPGPGGVEMAAMVVCSAYMDKAPFPPAEMEEGPMPSCKNPAGEILSNFHP